MAFMLTSSDIPANSTISARFYSVGAKPPR
jgi:hypothetical protein